jgi:hypothetical protein
MKKIFVMHLYLLSGILWADTQWECQESLMTYTAKLNQIEASKHTNEAIRFYQNIQKIVQQCKNANVDEDFDLDGMDVYGLRHLEDYAKKLANNKTIDHPEDVHFIDEDGARLVAWNPAKRLATFEITDYGVNYQKQIVLSSSNTTTDFKTHIGSLARILYNPSNAVLKQIAFVDDTGYEDSTTQQLKTNKPESDYVPRKQTLPKPVSQPKTDSTHAYQTQTDYPHGESDSRFYLYIFGGVFVIGLFMGIGENRKLVIFRDYDDLGLTFLLPVSAFVSFIVVMSLSGGSPGRIALWLGMAIPAWILGKLVKDTYTENHGSVIYMLWSLLVKIPLASLWVFNLFTLLDPDGKTAKKRRSNRKTSLMFLALLTPLIGLLVVEKKGSYFNPKSWLKGKRIGSIRNHL